MNVTVDTVAPTIQMYPSSAKSLQKGWLTISGIVSEDTQAVWINGQEADVDDGVFEEYVKANSAAKEYVIRAVDRAGNESKYLHKTSK
jgi:hypothetical protein